MNEVNVVLLVHKVFSVLYHIQIVVCNDKELRGPVVWWKVLLQNENKNKKKPPSVPLTAYFSEPTPVESVLVTHWQAGKGKIFPKKKEKNLPSK